METITYADTVTMTNDQVDAEGGWSVSAIDSDWRYHNMMWGEALKLTRQYLMDKSIHGGVVVVETEWDAQQDTFKTSEL